MEEDVFDHRDVSEMGSFSDMIFDIRFMLKNLDSSSSSSLTEDVSQREARSFRGQTSGKANGDLAKQKQYFEALVSG